ncbi:Ubiquinol-cytochrome c reductase iron-sulfur subunit [Legionella pneumophila]|uniref:Ubiquinol-cytochrome c reductase iron-sulfur subunit n=3 Tax=Legionella pneumophila TaxID=446 RepID=A0A131MZ39_LEGPN|nr:ubiquinol-cytochrome c reductase, iron-sulfur subunit [Legionella pneumophila str. Corby]AMV15759.1 Ubiquinol-cytochrome c reductase iron-sulfur subunit [Legionella pneumophila]PNL76947.1 ubiquinol-cytochrome c reductase iron-sulfur subunit [Legionella pneumophila subsp. pneumophila]HAT8684123.1 ubiquinol-cytochrome c reductase iron-sulfur subunit [Legionella pneumophila subsp. pneumophila ATCC 43283]PPK26609.1 ubiquinol-cytochrome c reductase iron-sulfur subunit [Legionella pneumophila]
MSEMTDLNQDVSNHNQDEQLDEERRRFLLHTTCVLGGVGAACALTPFITSWLPSSKAQAAGAPVKVDVSRMEPGEQAIIEWRGKPVWIIKRSKDMLNQLQKEDESQLRDPDSLVDQQPEYAQNKFRSINPEFLVLIGICTHLGCSPKYKPNLGELGPDWPGGFFCPCHGSMFDLSGRVFKGVPAPINLEVPPYHFLDDHTIVIGEDAK